MFKVHEGNAIAQKARKDILRAESVVALLDASIVRIVRQMECSFGDAKEFVACSDLYTFTWKMTRIFLPLTNVNNSHPEQQ